MTIELCDRLSVTVDGRHRESDLPGRQGRLALAYLALVKAHAATRDQLMAALWDDDASGHAQALNVILSKLRRAVGPGVIESTGERGVALAPGTRVDLDEAEPALDEAFAARARHDARAVMAAAGRVIALADAGLLTGYEASWLDEPRRRLDDLGLKARELQAEAGLTLGGAQLEIAERAAHELVERAPFRESGHLLLMRVREAQGNVAEALGVYDRLRVLLREELGVVPGQPVQAEFERLLMAGERDEQTPSAPARPFFATRSGAAFVGRRGELERMRHVFRQTAGGCRQLVLLEGEPGIGKTRLALQVMAACEDEGALALYGRCDAETLVPYQPFVEALRQYIVRTPNALRTLGERHGPVLGGVMPELGHAPATEGREESERYRLFEAVSEVLTDVAHAQPVVLVLDDLHWADKPTLLMLRQMVRSVDEARLLIVATYRDTERPAELADMLVQLRREHFFERMQLGGLDEGDANSLIESFGRRPLPGHVSRMLWEETRGNPFFLEEMLRHLETRPEDAAHELPDSIRDVIGRRLATLSERTLTVLTTAAVIGREFTLEQLEAVGPYGEDELDEVVEEGVAAQVIAEVPSAYGRCSFTHSLIRQTLYDRLTVTRRARLHLRVGEALEQLDADALAELAHHFSLAPPRHGAAKAVDYAQRAAKRAASVLAYEEAERLYAIALESLEREGPDEGRRCALLLGLGDAQAKAGATAAARSTFLEATDVARALGSARGVAQAALGYGMAGMMLGGVVDDSVVRLLEEALAEVGDQEARLRARLLSRLAIELSFSDERERRADLSREALDIARREDDTSALGFALAARHWSLWGPQNVEERLATANELLDLAQRAHDERLAMQGHRWRMIDLLELGEIDAVDVELEAHAQLAAARRRPLEAMYVRLYRATRLLLAGELDEIEALSTEALRIGERVQDTNALQAHVLQMVALSRERGGLDRLEALVRHQAERFVAAPGWRCVLAHVHAEIGRPDDARATLDEFARDGFRALPLDGIWLGALAMLAEVAVAVDDPTHAGALNDLLAPYADRNVLIGVAATCAGSASRYLGLLAGLLGRRDDAIGHFERALAMNERMGARGWAARTRVELARLLLQTRFRPARAAALLDEGLSEARALGMPALVALGESLAVRA